MTKVILTHEVEKLGTAGDVVDVKPGYARNYLLPRKLATPWTKGAQKQIDQMKTAQAKKRIDSLEQAHLAKEKLSVEFVVLEATATSTGRLFGAVSTADISAAIQAQTGVSIDRRNIVVTNPIKSLGSHPVSVRLYDDIAVDLQINVRPA